jgi:hypothetical protein
MSPTVIKLIGWGLIVAGVALMGNRVTTWRASHEALPGVEQALAREESCEDGSKCFDRVNALKAKQAEASREAVAGYELEIEALRNRPERVRTIRLCPEDADRDVRDAAVAGRTGPGSAAAGMVHPGTRPDIGPGLYALTGIADELSAQCRAIIQRDRALSALPIEASP